MPIVTRTIFGFSLIAALCMAQTDSARIEGTVTDQTGAVVAGAKITALDIARKKAIGTVSSTAGVYVLPALQTGKYSLTVEAPGFRKSVINNIDLDVDAILVQPVKLEVGQVTESVEVQANTVSVQTTDSQISNAITMRSIDTLPQLARTPLSLAIFQPGVAISQNGSSAGVDNSFSHINGARQGSNNNTLDGIDVNDAVAPRLGLSLTANNTDSVEEFRVISQSGKAEYGRSAGGQVELITRSGTNSYHGNVFDYLRNTDFNANDFFANTSGVARPVFIQNIFGGTFGGPIKHNKLFIFGNYQGRRTTQQIVRNRVVPTVLAKQGIFQWIPTGGSSVSQYNIVANDPLGKGIDPFIANLLKYYPTPNNTALGDGLNTAGYLFTNPNGSLEDQFTIKADYNLSSKMHIFFRESWERNSSIDSLNSADAYFPNQPQGMQGGHRWGVASGWDWTITPTMVNEFRYGHQSASVQFIRPDRDNAPMVSTINDSWQLPINPGFAQGRNSPVNEYADSLTNVRGKHTFKAGGTIRYTKQYGYNNSGTYPNISLSTANNNVPNANIGPSGLSANQLNIFQGLYDNILGRISSVTQTYYSDLTAFQPAGAPSVRNFHFHEYGYFFQDDWRFSPRLTFNLGLRYEFSGVPSEEAGKLGVLSNAAQLNAASHFDGLTVQKAGAWYNNDWKDFAPRFGFAYDVGGNGKTVVRGAYGIFRDRIIGAATSSVDGNTPGFSQAVPVYPNVAANSDVRITGGLVLPQQPAAPVLTLPATRSTSAEVFIPNLKNGYVQQWNLTVQREVARNTVVSAGYIGNRGVKLFDFTDINQTQIYGDFLTSFQQIQAFVANKATVPASNTLVKIFGSPTAVVSAIGASTFTTGQVRTAANTVDINNYAKYVGGGVSEYYLRNFPQYNQFIQGNNNGRSYYDSLQLSFTRQMGGLRIQSFYTYSKSQDNGSVEGNGYTDPIDNFNLKLNKGRSDFDRPSVFNINGTYTLPIGKGHRFFGNMPRWGNTLFGGWDIGALSIWESGPVMTVSSGLLTGPSTATTWANYSGSRNIGSVSLQGSGVYFFTPTQISAFSEPDAGFIGNSGRNSFRGPRYFNIDTSMVKRFAVTEKTALLFRAEAYNVINNVNFAAPGLNLQVPSSFGKIASTVSNARLLQLAMRFEF